MIYKLYSTISTADGLASFDIQDDGFIVAVHMVICAVGLDAVNDSLKLEVSFMSSNTFTTNDTRGSIAQHCVNQQFLTTGGGLGSSSATISGLAVGVSAGERIFMHGSGSAGSSASVGTVYIYVEDGQSVSKLRPPRRRR